MTASSSCRTTRRSARFYADWAGLDDAVFDVAVTPNRQDCMGVRGIARDLAAAGLGTLKPLKVPDDRGQLRLPGRHPHRGSGGLPGLLSAGSIRGLKNGPSPDWLQQRLKSAGQRPISALVDITNYVMLDLGRPAHAYDLDELKGAVTARRARDGETVWRSTRRNIALDPSMTRDRRRGAGPRHRRDHGRRA